MPASHAKPVDPRRLQRVLLVSSVLGVLAVGAIVAAVGIVPLWKQLTTERLERLSHTVSSRGSAVDEVLRRHTDVAVQIASRSAARGALEDFNAGRLDLPGIIRVNVPILSEALRASDDLVAIHRLSLDGRLTTAVGKLIPREHWLTPPPDAVEPLISGPVDLFGERYLVVGTPVLTIDRERVGTDVALFSTEALESIVRDDAGLGETGELVLGRVDASGVRVLFPSLRKDELGPDATLPRDGALGDALASGASGGRGLRCATRRCPDGSVIAYRGLALVPWAAAVRMSRDELFADLRREALSVAGVLTLALLAAMAGMTALLRPLTGRVVLHADELTDKLDEATGSLRAELAERRRAEAALVETNRELDVARVAAEQASRAKALFLANMSHEIRTPLNAVIGMTSLLADTELRTQQREYVDTIRTSGEHLLTLLNDVLDFSKIEAGRLELEDEPFDLRECVEECVDLVAIAAARKHIELTYILESRPAYSLLGDVGRVRQVLVNLLSNAIKFTPEEGEVSVRVDAREDDGGIWEVHFAVRDTGIGIPADRMDRLFQTFSQIEASTTRRFGGTGLGLAISRRLCELMGGRIWVESVEGEGSTFHFTIRVPRSDTPIVVASGAGQRRVADRRVAIVDDNATNRRILSTYARSWGMIVREADRGAPLLDWIDQGDPLDLVLTDYHMPGMDGIELARRIKERRPGLKVLMLSSIGEGRSDARDAEVPLDGYLLKPAKPDAILEAMARALGATPTRAGRKPAAPALDDSLGRRHPLRLLLAEDNRVNQVVALGILERLGYGADVAGNGLEAIQALERQPYDVVLMDVQMPEMDGIEASREICRRWPVGERPRIIAMTAEAMAGDRERCIAAGMDGYVPKPVRVEDLAGALAEAWRARNREAGEGAPPPPAPEGPP